MELMIGQWRFNAWRSLTVKHPPEGSSPGMVPGVAPVSDKVLEACKLMGLRQLLRVITFKDSAAQRSFVKQWFTHTIEVRARLVLCLPPMGENPQTPSAQGAR